MNKIDEHILAAREEIKQLEEVNEFFSNNFRIPVDDEIGLSGSKTRREMETWLFENDIVCLFSYKNYVTEYHNGVVYYFEFKKEEDATAFKLRWL